ncbi:hypothetical protein [Chondromyces apiculatus]|uniref:hypothetical protein n=1 Tax=Chondromyces apiculatus TaxID=51 RepID=UPI0005C5F31D|nr:hypothetical protein [Chondromyces apiculatus]
MSGGLMLTDGGAGGAARCVRCGAEAAGPCARCEAPVCGDCCVLTEGGARVWAICLRCDARGGRSLRGGWWMVISWIALPILALAAAVALLEWLTRR